MRGFGLLYVDAVCCASGLYTTQQHIVKEIKLSQTETFQYRDRPFALTLCDDGAIELYLDGVLRKRRDRGEREPQYVWTNVELEWEEHHYIEAKFWASTGQLLVTVNGEPLVERTLSTPG